MKAFTLPYLMFTVLYLNILSPLSAHDSHGSQHFFIENQGQWSSDFKFKLRHAQGAMYLHNHRMVHHLFDLSFLATQHTGEKVENAKEQPINQHTIAVDFVGADPFSECRGEETLEEYHNYFLGSDERRYKSRVPLHAVVRYTALWPGIDMVVDGGGQFIKYQFELRPGAQPEQIALRFKGQDSLSVVDGALIIYTSLGELREAAPVLWQTLPNGEKAAVEGRFEVQGDVVRFVLPQGFNSLWPLVIDPVLVFSTYSGAVSDNFGFTATYDSRGYLYSGSISFDVGYPVTTGAYQTLFKGGCGFPSSGIIGVDVAITKYDTNGSRRMFSTYLGGNCDEIPHSMVVNSRDELYLFGTTSSTNFPTTWGAYKRNMTNPSTAQAVQIFSMGVNMGYGTDLFVTAFNEFGTALIASTYVGGSQNDGLNNYDFGATPQRITKYNYADEARGEIDIDPNDNVYIASTTRSLDFPVTSGAFQTTYGGGFQDGVILKMNRFLGQILWGSFLGGFGHDAVYSLAIDDKKNIYVAGGTNSNNFRSGSYNSFALYQGGRTDGFITHIDSNGASIINSTFYGTAAYDQIYFVELDRLNNVYVFGQTEDYTNRLIRNAIYNRPRSGQFISKFTPQLDTTIWSTTFGTTSTTGISRPNLSPTAFLVDVCNAVYLSGWGGSTNTAGTTNNSTSTYGLDTTTDAYQKTTDGSDFYIMALADDASRLIYSSFLGGSADEHVDGGTSRFDKKGKVYQSVCAACRNTTVQFPTTAGVVARTSGFPGGCNNAVFKMDFNLPIVVAEFQTQRVYCTGDSLRFDNLSKKQKHTHFVWYFGNGDSSLLENPVYRYDSIGRYRVMLVVYDTSTCNIADTAIKFIELMGPASSILPSDTICQGDTLQVGLLHNPSFLFRWMPGKRIVDSTAMQAQVFPVSPTLFTQLVQTDVCVDTYRIFIHVDSVIRGSFTAPDTVCAPDTIHLSNQSVLLMGTTWRWFMPGGTTSTDYNAVFIPQNKGKLRFILQLTDSAACVPEVHDTLWVTTLQDSSFVLPDRIICHATPVVLGPVENMRHLYQWNTGKGLSDSTLANPMALPETDTTYLLRIQKPYCRDSAYQKVFRDSLWLMVPGDTDVCSNVAVINLLASSRGTAHAFLWSNFSNFTDTLNQFPADSDIVFNPAAQFLNYYYVKVSSRKGCLLTDTVSVRVNEFAIYTDTTERICLGDSLWLRVRSRVPNDELDAVWSPPIYMLTPHDSIDVLLQPKKPTLYRVETENRIKCKSRDSVSVFVSSLDTTAIHLSTDKDTLLKNESAQMVLQPQGYAYRWSPADDLSHPYGDKTTASPLQSTTYTVEIFDPEMSDCRGLRQQRITVIELNCADPDIFVPNTFTPNNDGKNDMLYVRGRYVKELKFIIYNRWGEEVFKTEQQNSGWDGNYKGERIPSDVYMYYLYVQCADEQVYETKGDITILY